MKNIPLSKNELKKLLPQFMTLASCDQRRIDA